MTITYRFSEELDMAVFYAQKHAQEATKRLFGHGTEEQNKALKDIKIIGSPKNTIRTD